MTFLSCTWDEFISQHPGTHYRQTGCWGKAKKLENFTDPVRIAVKTAGAQILFPRLPAGIKIAYIPHGPVGTDWPPLWQEVGSFCKKTGAIFLKVEPDTYEPVPHDLANQMQGFQKVVEYIQPRRNIVVDLTGGENDWLARMSRTGRQNVKLGLQRGVKVHISDDINTFCCLVECTAQQRSIKCRSRKYLQKIYEGFIQRSTSVRNGFHGVMLLARYEDKALAGLIALANGSRSWGVYTGARREECQRKASHLIQFEAMRWAARMRCTTYDLENIPDYAEEYLESHCNLTEGEWGLYRFKRGFGGKVMRTVGSFDRVYNYPLYSLYKLYMRIRGGYEEHHI